MKLKIILFQRLKKEQMSKSLSKYIASFDYFDKSLIVLSVAKRFLKTINKKKNHNKIVMLSRSKLNSIESKISEALINNEISHEDFVTIINDEKKYRELKERIKTMNSQRSDVEKVILIEEGKEIVINEVIRRNEIINNSLK